MIEYAHSAGVGVLSGLAEASGRPLRDVVEMATKGQLGSILYRGGPRYVIETIEDTSPISIPGRSIPATPRRAQLSLTQRRLRSVPVSARHAQLSLMNRRYGTTPRNAQLSLMSRRHGR
jgi:hypothetical protein